MKILFMLDIYYPNPMPNGICVHRVAGELVKLNYEVHIIAYRDNKKALDGQYEGVHVHRINLNLVGKFQEYGKNHSNKVFGVISYKIASIIRKIQKLIFLPWFPLSSPLTVFGYYNKAIRLHEMHKFNCIIAVFNPDEPLFASALLKKKLQDIKYGAYILDSLIYLSGQNYLPPGLKNRLSWKFEKMVYATSDKVFNMECHRVHHQSAKYLPYKNKMFFLDTPLFTPKKPIIKRKLYDSHKKHLVYMGSLFKGFRNPDYLNRLFQKINSFGEHQLHFYTRGSCEDDLLKYQVESHGTVMKHGFVAHSEIDNIIANSDFLINIGVSNSTAISSKIFDYMSTGKPIIHLYYLDDDINLRYLNKYELSITLRMEEDLLDDNAIRLQEFLIKAYGRAIKPDKLLETFRANTPMYTAKVFDELAQGN